MKNENYYKLFLLTVYKFHIELAKTTIFTFTRICYADFLLIWLKCKKFPGVVSTSFHTLGTDLHRSVSFSTVHGTPTL